MDVEKSLILTELEQHDGISIPPTCSDLFPFVDVASLNTPFPAQYSTSLNEGGQGDT